MLLSDVCLSRTSGLTWEQRGLGRLNLAQRQPTSHVTRTPLSRSKGQRSRSSSRFTQRGLNAWGRCMQRWPGNYCYIASARRRARRPRGRRGRGHIVSPRAQLVLYFCLCIVSAMEDIWDGELERHFNGGVDMTVEYKKQTIFFWVQCPINRVPTFGLSDNNKWRWWL